jgi:hypothetical protein
LVIVVDRTADISQEGPFGAELRRAAILKPAVLTGAVAQAVLYYERFAPVESRNITVEAAAEVVRMHALGPTVVELLLHCSPGELQPTLVEISVELVGSGLPDKDRQRVEKRVKHPMGGWLRFHEMLRVKLM